MAEIASPSNPYAPPASQVADIAADGAREPAYFPISTLKLLVMCFGTLGLYQFYWFYRNWQAHKARTQEDISPFWRTFFGVFYCYPLFRRMRDCGESLQVPLPGIGGYAAAWIIPSLLWRLPDPYWIVSFLAYLALVPVQQAVNRINERAAPGHDRNDRLRAWNWLAVFPGLPIFALAIFGAFAEA
jgi:hypothetical protein